MEFLKRYQIHIWALALISIGGYYLFAYELKRTDHLLIFITYIVLFVGGLLLTIHFVRKRNPWLLLFLLGLLFRLSFLLVTPHLSDDYFRFTWDGELQNDGYSAFEFLPKNYKEFFKGDSIKLQKYENLYEAGTEEFPGGLNSKNYYSIYPTVNQFVFATSSMIGSPNDGNLIMMRIWILIAEVVSFFLLRAILKRKHLSESLSGLYWLNPLIIVEITGNLHFEGFAIMFILLTLILLFSKKASSAGVALAFAICSKLNPLFLIVAVFKKVSLKRFILFASITTVVTALLLSLILDGETFWNFKSSFGLYFAWFSFNAGPYAAVKEIGLLITGLDISDKISLVFPFLTMILFIWVAFRSKREIHHQLLLLYVIYFSFSPVVHPWYLTVLIPLAIISKKLYPILWCFLVFFTYATYGENYGESNTLIFIEYGLVYLLMYVEYKGNSQVVEKLKSSLFSQ